MLRSPAHLRLVLAPIWRRLTSGVPGGESRRLTWSFAYFFFLSGSFYIVRPVRETMGTIGDTHTLSWLFTGTFVVMLAAVPAFAALIARFSIRRFVTLCYRFFVCNIGVFAVLMAADVPLVYLAPVFFVWTSVFNLFVVSVFWSVMADLFQAEQGRRVYGYIGAGGTLGTLAGSWLTSAYASALGMAGLLVISALALECAVFCVGRLFRRAPMAGASMEDAEVATTTEAAEIADEIAEMSPAPGRARRRPDTVGGTLFSGLWRVVQSPYLLGIGAYVLCLASTATLVYFQQAEIVRASFDDPSQKTAFFALINLVVGSVTILMQVLLTGRLLRWLSLAAVLTVSPMVVGAGLIGLAIAPLLWVIVAFQAIRRAANYAFARPSRELLFTVLPREDKYKSKNFIDTVVYRGGDMLGGWAFSGLTALGLGISFIAVTALPIAGLWLGLGVFLGRKQARLSGA